MKKKVFAFWISIILLFIGGVLLGKVLLNNSFSPFVASVIGEAGELLADGQKVFYQDVNNDGNSEEFIYYNVSDNRQPIINQYSADGKFQNLWYLDGEVFEGFVPFCGDFNNDGQKEIYVFAKEKEVLYLYGIEPNKSNKYVFDKVAVCEFSSSDNARYVTVQFGGVVDMNNDGFGELVFSVNSRYASYPRKVFYYDIFNGELKQSENLGIQLVGEPIVFDIDDDSLPEVFLSTLNSTTQAWISPQENALHSSTVILDANLQKKFEPFVFKSRMSVTASYPYVRNNKKAIVSASWALKPGEPGQIVLLNKQGQVLSKAEIKNKSFVFDGKRQHWNDILLFTKKGEAINFDAKLNFNTSLSLPNKVKQVKFIDIDGDGTDEIILVQNNTMLIYDRELQSGVPVNLPGLGAEKVYFSIVKHQNQNNNLSIQSGKYQYIVSYNANASYEFRYLIFLLIGALFSLIFYVIRRIYLVQIDKVKQSNKKEMELQIELMKNQLDPHFLFNALNSISYSINKDDRKTAYYNLGIFSKLLRESIGSMDEFCRTLEEEINYTSHYLHLEKFRFKEQFEYHFILSPAISKSVQVPKMCLFCFVESALKKGVLPKPEGGQIAIKVDYSKTGELVINIQDDGLYRNIGGEERTLSNSILAVQHIIGYFNSFNRLPIKTQYFDRGTSQESKGSLVTITIPKDYMYVQY